MLEEDNVVEGSYGIYWFRLVLLGQYTVVPLTRSLILVTKTNMMGYV